METLLTEKIERIGGVGVHKFMKTEYLLNLDNVISFEPCTLKGATGNQDIEYTKMTLVGGVEVLLNEKFFALVEELHK